MSEKQFIDGIDEGMQFCIDHINDILESLRTTGQKKTKVYVTLSNVIKKFETELSYQINTYDYKN